MVSLIEWCLRGTHILFQQVFGFPRWIIYQLLVSHFRECLCYLTRHVICFWPCQFDSTMMRRVHTQIVPFR